MYSYATLSELLQQEAQTSANALDSTQQAKLLDYARRASKVIEGRTDLWFVPELRTRYYNVYPRDHVNTYYNTLQLDAPLCAITSVAIGDTTLISTDYRLFPYGETPSFELQRKRDTGTWFEYEDTDDLYAVTGTWVSRSRYDTEGWIDSNDTVTATALTSTATSLTVTDADGVDDNLVTPRFSAGQIIRIESEYCIVTAVNTTTNTLTITRGARGTTAAAHDTTTTIYTFNVEPEIVRACQLVTLFNFANIGNYKRVEFNVATGANDQLMEVPDEAMDIMMRFRRKYVKAF
jgi:hypothetical protein